MADYVRKTDDAGRWRHPDNPSGTLAHMCSGGKDFYRGQAGKILLQIRNSKDPEQSWHGDWFVWSQVDFDNGMRTVIK